MMNMNDRPSREVDTRSGLPQVSILPRTATNGAASPHPRAAGPCQGATTTRRRSVASSPSLPVPDRRSTPAGLSRPSVWRRRSLGCCSSGFSLSRDEGWEGGYERQQEAELLTGGWVAGSGFEECGDNVPDLWCIKATQTESGSAVNDVLGGQGPLFANRMVDLRPEVRRSWRYPFERLVFHFAVSE